MNTLEIDIESYSDVDLKTCGVYRYAESENFEILLFGVSVDGGPVTVYDLVCGDRIPDSIITALSDTSVTKWAHNAAFERVCLSAYLRRHYPQYFRSYGRSDDTVGNYLDPHGWKCTMVLSAYNGLPLSLGTVGVALGFDKQKMEEGKNLIRYFCVPCRPTKANGGRTRNLPHHAPEKWDLFKSYNLRDVEVEMQILHRLQKYQPPEDVWQQYHLSEEINDRGIRIDHQFVTSAIRIDAATKERLTREMQQLTGLQNPNSVIQMTGWLKSRGVDVPSLGKKDVAAMLKTAPDSVRPVLELRQQAAKSSVKKYTAMQDTVCADGRCRGMFQFYGASRTGRFSGRKIQLQNLPQNHLPDLAAARELVRTGDVDMLSSLYENVPNILSELIRTAFLPEEGRKYIVADFSAIEARVLAYLAGEQWVMDVFRSGGDIYCETASRMFHVPVEKHGQNPDLRQKGKQATLSCGYGGSVGALRAMGALDAGMSEDELQPLVDMWRAANPHIVNYWWAIDRAVKTAIRNHTRIRVGLVEIVFQSGMLFIFLPSGRRLSYVQPRMGRNKYGGESFSYMGVDATNHWSRIESYGPKVVENVTQAISRDILCYALHNLSDRYIVGHVHDEAIIEAPEDTTVKEICTIMGQTPPWAPGLLLKADGYECPFYQKS